LRLSDKERDDIKKAAESVAGGRIFALAAYGSKVAGYSREDSDYDAILLLNGYSEGIRYRYVKNPVPVSFVLVDSSYFIHDAKSSYLGEFVAGRLLNVYEPIINESVFREAEIEFKRRVIVESLYELSTDYGEFLEEVMIPYEYFLFDKLKKRARLYPPALYSYVKTYTCPLAKDNKEISVSGFKQAARILEKDGFVKCYDNYLKIGKRVGSDAFGRILSLFSLATRGITQYAVHGYAGRVGFKVIKEEASSKLRRRKLAGDIPKELDEPKILLCIDEGILIPSSDVVSYIAGMNGMDDFVTEEKGIGEVYSTTSVLTISGGNKSMRYVVKRFSDVRAIKWVLLNIWAATSRKFSMSPLSRMHREYKASLLLKKCGIDVPSIVAISVEGRTIVKQYVDGITLSDYINKCEHENREPGLIMKYGYILGKAHSCSVAIGDTKPSNVLVSGEKLYLTDLEQASENGDYAWDIAEFIYYTSKLTLNETRVRKVTSLFVKGYLTLGKKENLVKAFSSKYVAPFRPFLTPGTLAVIKDAATKIAGG
jgi:tRNA A-37 threonylcarbamoyl transferase component Bud32